MIELIIILFVFSLLVGVLLQWKTIKILKTQYTENWVSLGKPHFINNSIGTAYKLHKFIWKKTIFGVRRF